MDIKDEELQGLRIDERIQLVSKIGRGGQAPVWKAKETETGREVAVKFAVVPDDGSARISKELMEEEIKKIARAQCSSIVEIHFPIHEILAETEARPKCQIIGYVMPYMRQGSLKLQKNQKQLREDPENLSKFIEMIVLAVHELHKIDIIHGDLKPDNILVMLEGGHLLPKVADFGASFLAQDGIGQYGTFQYMAPERFSPGVFRGDAAKKSDIYSLGLLIFEIISGSYPYDISHGFEGTGNSEQDFFEQIHKSHDIMWGKLPSAWLDIKSLLDDMLQKDPLNRPRIDPVLHRIRDISREFRITSPIARKEKSEIEGCFLWYPSIHRALGCRRTVHFIRGQRFLSALDRLHERIQARSLSGFSMIPVFGRHDVIITAWEESGQRKIHTILDQIRLENHGELKSFEIESYYHSSEERIQLTRPTQISRDEVQKKIRASAEYIVYLTETNHATFKRGAFQHFKKIKFAQSIINVKKTDILLFIKITWLKRLEAAVIRSYRTALAEALAQIGKKSLHYFAISFVDSGDQAIIECCVSTYNACGTTIGVIYACLSDPSVVVEEYKDFTTETYLDTLSPKRVVSEDGLIAHRIMREMGTLT